MADLNRFFKRNDIEIEKILYIYHHGRKTIVCKDPGIEVSTQTPFREVLAFLPKDRPLGVTSCSYTLFSLHICILAYGKSLMLFQDLRFFHSSLLLPFRPF